MNDGKELRVEVAKPKVDRLAGASPQEDRQPDGPSLELSFVKEPQAWQRCTRHGRRSLFLRRKRGRGARLVVVFDEAKEPVLVRNVGEEMLANAGRVVVLEPIVEAFVVAEVEPEFLELPLEVPVRFGDEKEIRMRLLDGRNDV